MEKNIRLAIYKLAFELYTKRSKYYYGFGLCYLLKESMKELCLTITWDNNPYYRLDLFPEIYKQKPEDTGNFWFPIENMPNFNPQDRISILNNAINELEGELNND